jgi:branched-chain amino acid transport system ATP-binding protein
MSAVLRVDELSAIRGTKIVLHEVSLQLAAGKIVALLGPNGAGKSSLVLALAGLLPLSGGTVSLDGTRLTGMPPHRIRQAGIAAIPEGHQTLTRLSVADNLAVAVTSRRRGDVAAALDRAYAIFPELAAMPERIAGSLSGGQQQMLALAQGIIADPKFILADEMSLGLAPVIVGRLMKIVKAIAESGVGVLLIEQFMHVALDLADTAYVINRGRIRFAGSAAELKADPAILHETYLSATPELSDSGG